MSSSTVLVTGASRFVGGQSACPDDPMLVFNLTDQIRETIQQTLHRLLIQRRNPFLGAPRSGTSST